MRPAARKPRSDSGRPSRRILSANRWKLWLRDGLRGRIIRTHDLPRGVRALVILGYTSVVFLLAATLFFELLNIRLPTPEDPVPGVRQGQSLSVQQSMPYLALAICSLWVIVGWALVLTGASDCRPGIFVPIVVLFLVQLFFLSLSMGWLRQLWLFLAIWLVAIPTAAHFFTNRFRYWREHPLLEFATWFAVASIFVGFQWLVSLRYLMPDLLGWEDREFSAAYWQAVARRVVYELSFINRFLALMSGAFWTLLGIELANIAVGLARKTLVRLRRARWESTLRRVVILALCAQLLVEGLVVAVLGISYQTLFFTINLSLATLLVVGPTAGLVLVRRWTNRAAATLLALNLALLVYSLGLFLILVVGKDFVEVALAATGLFPPILLFVFLTAYNVLNFGVVYANRESPSTPRTGRALLYLGAVILVCTYVLYMEIEGRQLSWQGPAAKAYWDGALYLGLPYLVWLAWKRPQRLVGHGSDTTGTQPQSVTETFHTGELSGKQWAAAGLAYGLLVLGNAVTTYHLWVARTESIVFPVLSLLGPSPAALGPIGILFGIIGYTKGARRLGIAAIAASVLAISLYVLFIWIGR
jgi:hypothetical protein